MMKKMKFLRKMEECEKSIRAELNEMKMTIEQVLYTGFKKE